MRALSFTLLLALVACVQEPAAKALDPHAPAVVVLPPDALEKTPPSVPLDAVLFTTAVQEPRPPPLSASSQLTVVPAAETSIRQVRQVTVAFEVLGAGAPSVAALEFIGPSGTPYQRDEVAITGSAFDSHHLEFSLPIAATVIDTAKMSGIWTARLLVDGKAAREQTFGLTP